MNIALNVANIRIEFQETMLYSQNTELSQTNVHDHSRKANEDNVDSGGRICEDGIDLKET